MEIIKNAKELIALGKHNECINQLLYWLNNDNHITAVNGIKEIRDSLLGLSNRANKLHSQELEGIIDTTFTYTHHNQLIKMLISDVNKLETIVTQISTTPRAKNSFNGTLSKQKTCEIELLINRDFKTFSEIDQRKLLKAISHLLEMDDADIFIKKKQPGSVKLTLELPLEKAKELAQKIKIGALKEFNVEKVLSIKKVQLPLKDSEKNHFHQQFYPEKQENELVHITSKPNQNQNLDADSQFLFEVKKIIEQNLHNPDFGSQQLCYLLYISRSMLHRKVKALTGLSPSSYIRYIRLREAKTLLEMTDLSIDEVAHEVGFNNVAYFSQMLSAEFDISPESFRSKK